MFVWLLTGSGKSVSYCLLPAVFDTLRGMVHRCCTSIITLKLYTCMAVRAVSPICWALWPYINAWLSV